MINQQYACYQTPIGCLQMGYKGDTLVALKKAEAEGDDGNKTPLTEQIYQELLEYFEGKRQRFTFKYRLNGTDFQMKVWQALLEIPYGETSTYKAIAQKIGNPKAARAVGAANHNNPIMIVVPCHRVIGSQGKLVGYAGGLDMKAALLQLEERFVHKRHPDLKGTVFN